MLSHQHFIKHFVSFLRMTTTIDPSNRARALWFACLNSALRTALACTIVGCATLYGPASLQSQVAFPAFSYVTVILIVTDATLGDTVRGCWLALYATIQSVCPAILVFWVIGPTRFSSGTTALAAAVAAFVVVVPESSHLVAKRIALGQIVIIYVVGFINGANTEPIMHPVHVAASTAVGVLACVLALSVPYPRLAHLEVRQNCKRLADIASKRLNLSVKALCAEENTLALSSISQVKALSSSTTELLHSTKRYQESLQWERLPFKISRSPIYNNPEQRLHDIIMPISGMELALTTIPSFPISVLDEDLKESLKKLEETINRMLKQATTNHLPSDLATVHESNADKTMKPFQIQSLQNMPTTTHQNLSPFLFILCIKLLHSKLQSQISTKKQEKNSNGEYKQVEFSFKRVWTDFAFKVRSQRLMAALKFSFKLGLATLFGLMYSKENGYWAGLPVAISISSNREATFKVANVKAQGTVLGTVYGVLGCVLFERYLHVRFLSLIPWFIFTSFLQRSRMYGQAGGVSAVIGAVLILGRKNFGPPSEFAIARITETFIGLSCSILVELVLQPTRASSLAKSQLSKSLGAVRECISSLSFHMNITEFEAQKKVKYHVWELRKFAEEAEAEPNFWFLPFNGACYGKLQNSLTKLADFLLYSGIAIANLEQIAQTHQESCKEIAKKLESDITHFKEISGSSLKCFQEVTLFKSLTNLQKETAENQTFHDIEMGKSQNTNKLSLSDLGEDEIEKNMNSFLQHSKEAVDKLHDSGVDDEVKAQIVLSLITLAFCLSSLIREIREVGEVIKELVRWENPSFHITNLHEISCKIHALQK